MFIVHESITSSFFYVTFSGAGQNWVLNMFISFRSAFKYDSMRIH